MRLSVTDGWCGELAALEELANGSEKQVCVSRRWHLKTKLPGLRGHDCQIGTELGVYDDGGQTCAWSIINRDSTDLQRKSSLKGYLVQERTWSCWRQQPHQRKSLARCDSLDTLRSQFFPGENLVLSDILRWCLLLTFNFRIFPWLVTAISPELHLQNQLQQHTCAFLLNPQSSKKRRKRRRIQLLFSWYNLDFGNIPCHRFEVNLRCFFNAWSDNLFYRKFTKPLGSVLVYCSYSLRD